MAPRRGPQAPAPMAPGPAAKKKLQKTTRPPSTDRPLTAGQERFAQEFVRLNNATEAYAIAHPTAKRTTCEVNGSNALGITKVAARVAALQAAVAQKNAISADWVVARLRAISDRCMAAEPVLDAEGTSTGVYTFDAAGANRSTELLGKSIGMFPTRVDLRDVSQMTDAELADESRRLGMGKP